MKGYAEYKLILEDHTFEEKEELINRILKVLRKYHKGNYELKQICSVYGKGLWKREGWNIVDSK